MEDLYLYNGTIGGHYITIISLYDDYLSAEYNYFEYMDTFNGNYGRGSTLGVHNVGFYDIYNSLHTKSRYVIW